MEIIQSLCLCFITLSFFTSIHATSSGFTTNLIHRDSPFSPHYNSSNTYYENIRNSIHRAMTRSSRIFKNRSSPPPLQSPVISDPLGEYLMKISVGTPPVDFLVIVDTGSDLTWIQCKPCIACYKQSTPLFSPKKSSTYKKQPCQSKACQSVGNSCDDKNICKYQVVYGDGSFSEGDLSLESFTFESTSGKPVVLPKISFGCGHHNRGIFDKITDGIVGLGNEDVSIVKQLSDTINGKFSYCLVPLKSTNVSSKISFGSDAVVSGSGVQTTPFFIKFRVPTFYYLNLESVSIGDTNIKFETKTYTNNADDTDHGNIIIDSGTTLTMFPTKLYQRIEDKFKRIISSKPVKGEQGLSLCYKNEEGFEKKVPTITFHFTGADWELGVLNTMLDMGDGKLCFTLVPGGDDLPIFGNLHQINYLVGYDLDGKTLSFKKTDCTKY